MIHKEQFLQTVRKRPHQPAPHSKAHFVGNPYRMYDPTKEEALRFIETQLAYMITTPDLKQHISYICIFAGNNGICITSSAQKSILELFSSNEKLSSKRTAYNRHLLRHYASVIVQRFKMNNYNFGTIQLVDALLYHQDIFK